jgi:hypothetical protein
MGSPEDGRPPRKVVGVFVRYDDGSTRLVEDRSDPFGMGDFHMTFEERYKQMIRGAPGVTQDVLNDLPGVGDNYLNWKNFKPLNQYVVAERIGIAQSMVSRALRDLLARGMVERKGSGPQIKWRMSSNWSWKGKTEAFHHFRRTDPDVKLVIPLHPGHGIAAEDIIPKQPAPAEAQRPLRLLRDVTRTEPPR